MRDDFIGGIAIEIVSSSLYEQQIPNIIYEHLEDMNSINLSMLSTSPIINIHLNLKSNLCRLLNKHNTLFQLA